MAKPQTTENWHTERGITPMQRKVLAGGSVGQFIEFYDFALYGLSAVVLSELFFPSESQALALLALFATYGVAFLVRPLGGLYFGRLGDRIGRRRVLAATLLLIGAATTAIGLLPTYAVIGALAPVLLVICRLLQGFSAGGESVGAPSFVFEHAPVHRRGLFVNITLAATALPSVFAAALILVLSALMSDAAFISWGWRIPFLIALPLAAFGLWIRNKTEESPVFQEMLAEQEAGASHAATADGAAASGSAASSGGAASAADAASSTGAGQVPAADASGLGDVFRANWVQMLQVLFIMGLTAMGFYFLSGYFVAYVETAGNLSREQSLILNAVAMTLYTILLPVFGSVSDKVGRRPMLIAGSGLIAVLALPVFLLVTSGSVGLALVGQLLFVLAITVYGGGCYTFFVEVFATKNRFTAAAISYNVGYALLGGTAPFIGQALVGGTGIPYSPAFYVIALALLVLLLIFITRVPETRGRLH